MEINRFTVTDMALIPSLHQSLSDPRPHLSLYPTQLNLELWALNPIALRMQQGQVCKWVKHLTAANKSFTLLSCYTSQ